MTNYEKIYWLTRLDSIQGLLFILVFMCTVSFIIYLVAYLSPGYHEVPNPINKKKARISLILGLIFGLCITFIPSKDEAVLIMAGGKTMDFIQQDTSINKIPEQTTKLISDFLGKEINQLNK